MPPGLGPGLEETLSGLGVYPVTQLGENLGLVVDEGEGLKLSTLWPCSAYDWAGAGSAFFSCFCLGEAVMPGRGRGVRG